MLVGMSLTWACTHSCLWVCLKLVLEGNTGVGYTDGWKSDKELIKEGAIEDGEREKGWGLRWS